MEIAQAGRRIFIVGDIHGMFSLLQENLQVLGYRHGEDILVSVGDLIDRGPENEKTLEWFNTNPTVYSVRGNHDEFLATAIEYKNNMDYWTSSNDFYIWVANGGLWATSLGWPQLMELAEQADQKPYFIQLNLDNGKTFGVIHAEIPGRLSWDEMKFAVRVRERKVLQSLIWGRTTIEVYKNSRMEENPVAGVDYIFCGHTVLPKPTLVGNRVYLDTGAVFSKTPPYCMSFAVVDTDGTFSVKSVKEGQVIEYNL